MTDCQLCYAKFLYKVRRYATLLNPHNRHQRTESSQFRCMTKVPKGPDNVLVRRCPTVLLNPQANMLLDSACLFRMFRAKTIVVLIKKSILRSVRRQLRQQICCLQRVLRVSRRQIRSDSSAQIRYPTDHATYTI